MLVIIPIRTESAIRRTPRTNYFLIGLNVFCFLLLSDTFAGSPLAIPIGDQLAFEAAAPSFYQFFTYQFLHADVWHLLGNMLFLWVFGNSVNSKMGDWPYMLFYLAGGVFAAWAFALFSPARLIGASGSIAAITTAYLALFPRSRVTVLAWFFVIIHFFEWPAMIIIGLKIIVWDNIIAPGLGGAGSVAHSAHLAGYFFGFVGALTMLLFRAIPRDQFDILAVWKRWNQRRALSTALRDPAAAARAQYGTVARVGSQDLAQQATDEALLDEYSALRGQIGEKLQQSDGVAASELYEQLVAKDAEQCLSERDQMAIGRAFYGSGRYPQAAAAYERFVSSYPRSADVGDIRLLLGIIYARDLRRFECADEQLTISMEILRDPARRDQCLSWLHNVRAALGKAAPET